MIGVLTVVGGKGSKGDYQGTKYDSTKLNVLMPYSRNNTNACGQDTVIARFGDAANIEKFRGKHFPIALECDYEMVQSGESLAIEIYEIVKINESPRAQTARPAQA